MPCISFVSAPPRLRHLIHPSVRLSPAKFAPRRRRHRCSRRCCYAHQSCQVVLLDVFFQVHTSFPSELVGSLVRSSARLVFGALVFYLLVNGCRDVASGPQLLTAAMVESCPNLFMYKRPVYRAFQYLEA